jgi:AraC family transcriptional regulator
MHETEAGRPLGRPYFEALAKALIIAVVSQTDVRLPDAGNLYVQHERIQRSVSYLEANFHSKLTIQDLARIANLSPFHFTRLFTRLVGLSPHEYVLNYRLRFAVRLLRAHLEYSISEIALASGFSDQSHFSKTFRRAFGKTPKAYRGELG